MYEIPFTATDDADWTEGIELIDAITGDPSAEAADASFELQVTDCGRTVLTAKTSDGTMTKPAGNIIAWTFTKAQLGALCAGTTYRLGCRITTDDGTEMLFTGSLAFIDGGMN